MINKEFVMTNKEFAIRAKEIATNYNTVWVFNTYGKPLRYFDLSRRIYGSNPKAIKNAPPDAFAFDCWGLVTAILWGFNGDLNHENGGAVDNGIPRLTYDNAEELSKTFSDDFSEPIMVGELLWKPKTNSLGIYIGDNQVVVSTPRGDGSVQIVTINNDGSYDMSPNRWQKHGKHPAIKYEESL